jgi:nicotinamide-nucleotide amidase
VTGKLDTAEVIAVGSEMLGATRLDTNSLYVTEVLGSAGVQVRAKSVVGDDLARIADLCRQAMRRADLIVLTGGLGPTDDDLTREAVAAVLDLPLVEDSALVAHIADRFARRGLTMPDINRRQAHVLQGATVIPNPNGTAPGQFIERDERILVLLPGPPRELKPMFRAFCEQVLAPRTGGARLHRATLFIAGRTESHVDQVAQPIYSAWRDADPPIETTILATPGQIELHLLLRSGDDAAAGARLREATDRLVAVLGADVFSRDGRTMEQVVGDLLRERRLMFAAAESCTGGLLLSRLTDVPGSSAYVAGGVVLYSDALKHALAGVPTELIAAHGAVSEPVAIAMAEGVRVRTHADVAVGITGIAGPGGGTPEKPAGTVAVAALVAGAEPRVRTFSFPGGRAQIKFHATQAALDMVRRALTTP